MAVSCWAFQYIKGGSAQVPEASYLPMPPANAEGGASEKNQAELPEDVHTLTDNVEEAEAYGPFEYCPSPRRNTDNSSKEKPGFQNGMLRRMRY
jgi:hypothetical protein